MALDSGIVGFFLKKGYSRAQARGIAAGVHAESRGDPDAKNNAGGGNGAFGIGQWRGPRQAALRKLFGANPTKAQQLEFLHRELQGGDAGGADVLAQDDEASVLDAYVKKFMRPAKGGETSGDIDRGRQALGLAKGGDPSSSGQSTYDRIRASSRPAPDLSRATKGVVSGDTIIANNRTKPVAHTLSQGVIDAYNSHAMDDNPEARDMIDAAVKDGSVILPRGLKLQRPKARTFTENAGMVGRAALEGLGDVADLITPHIPIIGKVLQGTGTTVPDISDALLDKGGVARPESSNEKLATAAIRGAAPAVITGPASAGSSILRATALDLASGAASGLAGEKVRQEGGGEVAQTAAALLAGGAPIAASHALPSLRARIGRNAGKPVAEIIADTPRSVIVDEAGNLTDDGAEIAAQHGITPKELREAVDGTPPPPDVAVANDVPTEARAAAAVGDDLPIQRVEEAPPVRAEPETPAPVEPVQPAAPIPPNEGGQAAPVPEVPLPASAAERVAQADAFGVPLSRGQATKSFDIQDQEQRLLASNGQQAEEARQFRQRQQESITEAVTELRRGFGDLAQNATERGQVVKDAIRQLRDSGRTGVTKLYEQAAALGGDNLGLITDDIRRTVQDVQIDEGVNPTVKRALDQEMARYGLVGENPITDENGITKVQIKDGNPVSFRGEPQALNVANAENLRQAINRLWKQDDTGALGPIKSAIDDAVEEALQSAAAKGDQTGAVGEAYARARQAHADQKQTFDNKDAIEQIHAWKKGTRSSDVINPEAVFDKIFAGGPEGLTNLRKVKSILLTNPTPLSKAAWRGIQAHKLAQIFEKATTRNTNAAGEILETISGAKLRSSIAQTGPEKLKVLLDEPDYNKLMKLRRVIEDATIPIAGTTNPSGSGNLLMRLLSDVDTKVTGAFASVGLAVGGPAGAAIGGTIGRTIAPAIKASREAKAATETLRGVTDYTPSRAAVDDAKGTEKSTPIRDAAKTAASTSVSVFLNTYGSPRIIAPALAAVSGDDE